MPKNANGINRSKRFQRIARFKLLHAYSWQELYLTKEFKLINIIEKKIAYIKNF